MDIGYRSLFRESLDAIKRIINVTLGRESADLILENTTLVNVITDDISAIDLVEKSYMDRVVRESMEYGLDPIRAIQAITFFMVVHDCFSPFTAMRYADVVYPSMFINSQRASMLLVTPSFRDPWTNRSEGARRDRDEPKGGSNK